MLLDRKRFWITLLLNCLNLDKYLNLFFKYMKLPNDTRSPIEDLILERRRDLLVQRNTSVDNFITAIYGPNGFLTTVTIPDE